MQIIGVILIVVVIALLFLYFHWSKTEAVAKGNEKEQKLTVVVEGAYNPNTIKAKVGVPLIIIFDRREDSGCSKKVLIPDFEITKELSDFGKTEIHFTPDKTGEFGFSCEMGMYQGKLIVEK